MRAIAEWGQYENLKSNDRQDIEEIWQAKKTSLPRLGEQRQDTLMIAKRYLRANTGSGKVPHPSLQDSNYINWSKTVPPFD